jgi:ABC-2 type transport system permease protein
VNKTWIIAHHEFSITVRRLSYVLLTVSFPLLALIGLFVYQGYVLLGEDTPVEDIKIGYVDQTGIFTQYTDPDGAVFILYGEDDNTMGALLDGEVDEYFIIHEDYLDTGQITRFTTKRELELPGDVMALIEDFLVANLLSGDVSNQVMERVKSPLIPFSFGVDPDTGKILPPVDIFAAFGLPYIFSILFMISIFFTSGYLLQGVSEEKENRLMEILLSSVSARQLLTGKVIGLGAAGLLQITVWFIAGLIFATIASAWIAPLANLSIPVDLIILGIIYFILGYLLYGIIWSVIGSLGANAREGSQLTSLVVLPAILPVMLIGLFIENPEHVIFTIFTLLPITAPITAVMKLSIGALPVWECVVSIIMLGASIVVAMWMASRIFRTTLLMYGKRPSFNEIWRYIREG